jgi:hypothetical protein
MDFSNLISAHKRAKHFGSIQFDGPFSILGTTGPSIPARNYCMLLDANVDDLVAGDTDDYLAELVILDMWARAINRYCDNNMIANDQLAKEAFACFASRLWIDVSKFISK